MEQQESGRLADKAAVAAVAASTQRAVSPTSDNAGGNSNNNGEPHTAEAAANDDDDDEEEDEGEDEEEDEDGDEEEDHDYEASFHRSYYRSFHRDVYRSFYHGGYGSAYRSWYGYDNYYNNYYDDDYDDDDDDSANDNNGSSSEIDNNGSDETDECSTDDDDSEIDNNGSDDTDERSTDDEDDDSSDDGSNDEATNSHSHNNSDAAVAATVEMPWGSSWWDKMPAEIRIMILDFVGPLQRFLTGQLGTKRHLLGSDETKATAVAIWIDAFKRDWKGDLDRLSFILPSVKEGLCEVRSRSMYERMCCRFRGYNRLIVDKPRKPSNLNTYHYKGRLFFCNQSLLNIPARHGWFDLLDFKHPITLGWFAIKYGHPALLRHLAFTLKLIDLSQFERLHHEDAMDVAAGSGCLEIVQMLHDAGNNNCTADAMDSAAACGYLDVMQWLHANRREGCTELASKYAARNGRLHVVEWLVEHYPSTVHKDAVIKAAEGGHVDVLAFLLPRFPDLVAQVALIKAAYEGHLVVIKCFHTHRPDAFTAHVFTAAVERGRADIVQFLLDCGYAFDVETLAKVKDPAIRKSMAASLTLGRARVLLEDAKTKAKGYKPIVSQLEAAVKRLEKAEADADKETIAK